MKTGPRQIALGLVIAVVFVGALFGAAWLGIAAAKRSLPDGVLNAGGPTMGQVLTLDTTREPLYLAPSVQGLRDFFFAFQSPEARRDGDAEARDLRRVFESLEVKILSQDADAYEIEVLDGPLAGVKAWVHRSQMPPPSPAP